MEGETDRVTEQYPRRRRPTERVRSAGALLATYWPYSARACSGRKKGRCGVTITGPAMTQLLPAGDGGGGRVAHGPRESHSARATEARLIGRLLGGNRRRRRRDDASWSRPLAKSLTHRGAPALPDHIAAAPSEIWRSCLAVPFPVPSLRPLGCRSHDTHIQTQ
ncbi:hypothetical protein FA95DRAFT_372164 [Auriscalpium vulgare]|uniref:Uncharacterized protein n=1 Tax=Auriscalpium vulgare TaxID=40419 RepID=A0ACB8RIX2_9AGAM|nr:hypothetical protein FA95DRAFT_372164 [Auriscalpium vulgare]